MTFRSSALITAALMVTTLAGFSDLSTDHSAGVLNREKTMLSAGQVTEEKYPNADAVMVDDYVLDIYEADGQSVVWDDEYIKVLTEKGRRQHRTVGFHFAAQYSRVEIVCVDVIKPDGTVVGVDVETQSREMVDPSQMRSNIYDPNQKILQVGLPGLEIGDVRHVISKRTTFKPRCPDTWSGYSVLEDQRPLLHLTYQVDGPSSLPLIHDQLRAPVGKTVTCREDAKGERTITTWTVEDVPRVFDEPRMPARHTVVQRLLLSTIPDWPWISRWYWELSLPHMQTVTPAIKAKVAELTEGATTRQARIERLFQFVSQEIRYMGITTETEAPGYEPHDVKTTFDNRYGVCRDKAALLAAMLTEAGIPGYPVLIYVGPRKDPDVPQPFFNHAITAAEAEDGSFILMDPTDENTADLLPAYLGNRSYIVAHPDGKPLMTSPVQPASSNLMRIVSSGKVTAQNELRLSTRMTFEGINDNAYRGYFSQLKPEERRRTFEGVMKRALPGAELTAFTLTPEDPQDVSRRLEASLDLVVKDYPVRGNGLALLPLPWLGSSVGYINFVLGSTGLNQRRFPLVTGVACGVEETFSIDVGTALGPLVAVPDFDTTDSKAVSLSREITVAGGTLSGVGSFTVNQVELSTNEYLELRRVLKDMEFGARKRPLFKEPAPPADMRVLSNELTVIIDSPNSWVSTRKSRLKILTYAGKKRHSELKFGFNPVWETITIAKAQVTMATGEVRTLSDEETNLMDAGWVGSAPRYPAARTMVLSLPGVEIGSIVEVEVERRVKDRPFFSLREMLNGHEPVDFARVSVTAPDAMALEHLAASGVAPVRHVDSGRVTLVWESHHQPAVPREDSLPAWWSFNPMAFASSGDWAQYAARVMPALTRAASERDTIRTRLAEVLDGRATAPTARLRAIRDFVAITIRQAGPGLSGLPLSALFGADRTLADGYGNTADRAAVMYALLSEAGFEPEFVLASSWAPKADTLWRPLIDTPQFGLFNTVLVRVALDGDWIYFNDTDQYAVLGSTPHHGRLGLDANGTPFIIAAQEDKDERGVVHYTVDVGEDGSAAITVERTYYGQAYGGFHRLFAELPPEERDRHHQELVARLSQSAVATSALDTDTTHYPGRKTFSAHIDRFAVPTGDHLALELPGGPLPMPSLRAAARVNPLNLPGHRDVRQTYSVRLPATIATAELLPREVAWTGLQGAGTVAMTVTTNRLDDGRLEIGVTHAAGFEPTVAPASAYGELKRVRRQVRQPAARTIVGKVGQR